MRIYIDVSEWITSDGPPPLGEKTTGVITYDSRWAYQDDSSINVYDEWVNNNPPMSAQPANHPTSFDLKNMLSPVRVYFNFPEALEVELTQIRLYDGQGGTLGNETQMHAVLADGTEVQNIVPAFHRIGSTNLFNGWHTHAIAPEHRFVRQIIYEQPNGAIWPTKIEFTGSYFPYNPTFPVIQRSKLGDLIGVNAFHWNTGAQYTEGSADAIQLLSRYDEMRVVRAYDDWHYNDNGSGEYRYEPVWSGGWKQDTGFERLKAKGIKIIRCVKQLPGYILATYPQALDNTGKQSATRASRNPENAYHVYKGNIVEYDGDFPENGETANLTFTLANASVNVMFPQTLDQPTYFYKRSDQLVHVWNGTGYDLVTQQPEGVYFDIYEAGNSEGEPAGKLKTLWNNNLRQDRLNPTTYLEYAKQAFQDAARYGSNSSISPSLIKSNDGKVGLDLIYAWEAGNELNAFWHGRGRYQSPFEMAALLSAIYDGHMGTLGNDAGVKTADPNLLVANGGIVSANPRFFRAMIDWCKENRGYNPDGTVNICWEIVKYHQYTNSNGLEQHSGGSTRVGMPADMVPTATDKVTELKQIHYEYTGKYPLVHIGEFGYDLGPTSQSVPKIEGTTTWNADTLGIDNSITGVQRTREQIIADWSVRDRLEYCWYGLNSGETYLLEDPYANSNPYSFGTLYGTSGLFHRGDVNPTYGESRGPRAAAWYLRQFGKHFGDYKPTERLSENPRIQKHEDSEGNIMYACWLPSMTGELLDYTLNLPGVEGVKIYTHQEDSYDFIETVQAISGSINLQLSETPIYLEAVTVPVTPDEITVEVTFDAEPTTATADFADWKYNKEATFNYEQDDNSRGIFNNLFPYLNGGIAEDGVNYPGIEFTDGCGNNIKATAAAATNSMSPSGDLHPDTSTVNMRYSDMAIMHAAGWSIENHGYGIDGHDRFRSVHRNTVHLYNKIKEHGRNARTRVFIVPANDAEYVDPAFYDRHIVVSSQTTFDGYSTNHPVSPLAYLEANLDKLMVQRRYTEAITTGQAEIWLDEFFASIDLGEKPLLRCFQHNVQNTIGSFGLVKHIFDYLKANTGDDVWITTMQDVYEYLETKRDVVKNESLVGNKLTITFDLSNISDYNRFRDMSLLIDADANITGVSVIGADSSSYNTATGLINIFKENNNIPDPNLEDVPPILLDTRVEFGETNEVTLFFNEEMDLTVSGWSVSGKTVTGISGSGQTWKLQLSESIGSGDNMTVSYVMRAGTSSNIDGVVLNSYVGKTVRNRVNIQNDDTDPTTPPNFRARKLTSNGYELVWDASTDNEEVLGYNIEVNGVWSHDLLTSLTLVVENQLPESSIQYRIRAVDVNYNYSTPTPVLEVTTLATTDYQIEKTIIASFGGNETTLNGFGINRIVSSLYNQVGGESQNLKATDGYSLLDETGITVEVLRAFDQQSTAQPSPGGNAGVFPDGAVNSAFRSDNTSAGTDYLKVIGLNPNKWYNFYILGNVTGPDSNARYTVGGISNDKAIYQNYAKGIDPDNPFDADSLSIHRGIQSNSEGEITIYIEKLGPADWVAINVLAIEETNNQYE